jgi:hypothetical protein
MSASPQDVLLTQTIIAANYVGIQTFNFCHSGGLADVKVPSWSKSAYNWQMVKYDGNLGIHNTAYSAALLKASIADLKGK